MKLDIKRNLDSVFLFVERVIEPTIYKEAVAWDSETAQVYKKKVVIDQNANTFCENTYYDR